MSRILPLVLFLVGVALVPAQVCARDAQRVYDDDTEARAALAHGVEEWVRGDLSRAAFRTGSSRFDGEWLFGTYMMAAMGFGQIGDAHDLERCAEAMLGAEAAGFDREAWDEDALTTLDGPRGHAAYLGYMNLALAMHRMVDPASRFARQGDRITDALARRLDASPIGLLETYPGEVYPVDNAAVVASIALRDRAAHDLAHAATLARALARMREQYIDPATGLLLQAVDPEAGRATDSPRGSGTLLAVYFLSYADRDLSRALWDAAERRLASNVLGFGVVREYATEPQRGDIDSGPIAFGFGVSATGFALAGARIHGDRERFARLYATATLFGAPIDRGGARRWVTGGPIGDAILFAMATAPRGAS
jgi:hypothetical protein